MSDQTSGFGVFAWHVRPSKPGLAALASIRSSLDHPVETACTGGRKARPANCIALSVTATIVTSFKVAFAFLRCDLRADPR